MARKCGNHVLRRHTIRDSLASMPGLRDLLDLLAPPTCVSCRRPAGGGLDVLCVACRRRLPWLRAPCPRCALPQPCGGPCPAVLAPWDAAFAPLAHDGPARDLVRALKFGGLVGAAGVMAAQIVAAAPRGLLAEGEGGYASESESAWPSSVAANGQRPVPAVALVPVPADRGRRRRRGLDHAALLAAELATRTGLPVHACLEREGPAAPRQLGAGRAQRHRAAQDTGLRVRGTTPQHAIVVDDVHTTGATFAACCRTLRASGAQRLTVISHTRSLP